MVTALVTERSRTSRRAGSQANVVVGAMTLAAFGPYILGGIRTEQVTVYALMALASPFALTAFTRTARAWWFVLPWLIIITAATLGELFPPSGTMPWPRGSLLAGVDNMLLPVSVLMVVFTLVPRTNAESVLGTFASIVASGGAINGFITIVSIRTDLTPWLRPFWSGEAGVTVAESATSMGRYSGIFNQPAEVGLFYSIAGLLAVYRFLNNPRLLCLLLSLMTVGGIMSVSKVFILVGLPLIFLYLFLRLNTSGRLLILPYIGLGALILSVSGIFRQWDGLWYLNRLLSPPEDQGTVEFFTAGRLGANASLGELAREVFVRSPVIGMGFAGWRTAYDSSWTEIFVLAGLIGIVCMLLLHAAALLLAARLDQHSTRWLAYASATLALGASFGLPAFSANRISTLVWILIGLLVLIAEPTRSRQKPRLLSQVLND